VSISWPGDDEPPLAGVAAPSFRVFQEYCYRHDLNPNRTRHLWDLRHLRGLRGRVVLITGPGTFPPGFAVCLSQMELDGLVRIEEARS
jgi:hypothetical protein